MVGTLSLRYPLLATLTFACLGFVYFASWDYFTSTYWPSLPHVGTCAGEEFAAFTGCAILSSYLLLFLSFYAATYKKGSKKGKSTAKRAAVQMEKQEIPTVPETTEAAGEALKVANDAVVATVTDLKRKGSKRESRE